MKFRSFAQTGLEVSEIGFGAWAIGGGMWGPTNDTESLRALRFSLDLGINFVDTASVYGRGHSEQLIAKVYRERSGKFYVATKIPPKDWRWPPSKNSPIQQTFPKGWVKDQTEKSLRNLKRDCVELQQIHVWSPNWVKETEWLESLHKLRQEGKIRFIGVSLNDHRPDEALELVQSGMVDVIQVIYNIFEQSPADKLFDLCQKNNVAVIARVPLDESSLTGKLSKSHKFSDEDWRKDYFTPKVLNETVNRVERLKFMVGDDIPSLPVAALKFCLSHPAVSTAIPGIRNTEQARENCSASDGKPLKPELLEELKKHRWDR